MKNSKWPLSLPRFCMLSVIVNEIYWNSFARRADIVFPSTSPLERDDLSGSSVDHWLAPCNKVVEPFGQSRDDYQIYAGLAGRLGFKDRFTEGHIAEQWVEWLYNQTKTNAARIGIELPDYHTYQEGGRSAWKRNLHR